MLISKDTAAALEMRRSHSLATLVQQEIERLILDGDLKAGERLNENALAARLGVSRGPIREATRGLEKAGLVKLVVNRGAFVREIGLAEASEIYDLRALMFGLACQRVAARQALQARIGGSLPAREHQPARGQRPRLHVRGSQIAQPGSRG